MNENI